MTIIKTMRTIGRLFCGLLMVLIIAVTTGEFVGNFSLTDTGRNAHFEISVSVPKVEGTLSAKAFRDADLGSNLRMNLEKDGRKIEHYNCVYPCQ